MYKFRDMQAENIQNIFKNIYQNSFFINVELQRPCFDILYEKHPSCILPPDQKRTKTALAMPKSNKFDTCVRG